MDGAVRAATAQARQQTLLPRPQPSPVPGIGSTTTVPSPTRKVASPPAVRLATTVPSGITVWTRCTPLIGNEAICHSPPARVTRTRLLSPVYQKYGSVGWAAVKNQARLRSGPLIFSGTNFSPSQVTAKSPLPSTL